MSARRGPIMRFHKIIRVWLISHVADKSAVGAINRPLQRRSMMATDVILPALGMSQDTGKIVQWRKTEGEQVAKGEPLVEIETDKATVEIQAPADGVLAHVSAAA